MHLLILVPLLSVLASQTSAALVQGACTKHDRGLKWLVARLTPNAVISCKGSSWQEYNAGRYWGSQFGVNASVVVFPVTTRDVSNAMIATNWTPLGKDFAFVGGAHGMTGASSAAGFVIDLSFMNSSEILPNFCVDGENNHCRCL